MASKGGPDVKTGGLVLSFDAASEKSFKGEPAVNTVPYPNTGVSRYNNTGFSGTVTDTGLTYKGSPIWEATFIPQSSSFIARLGSTEGFGLYHGMGTSLLGNTPYIASIYFRTDFPLAQTATQGFENTYSNISGWGANGTANSRYQEDGWTRLWTRYLNNVTVGGVGYAGYTNSTSNTVTVNTTTTTDITITVNILANSTITSTTNVNTSAAAGLSQVSTSIGIYDVSPSITSTNVAGMATGTSTIINHGTNTTTWTKLSTSNTLLKSNFPVQYYIQVRVPSTGGVNQTFVLRPSFASYHTALSDSKYWKITFDTTGVQVGQVIKTYWAAPMLEQRSTIFPTQFTIGTRGTTVAAGGGWADRSGKNLHGELVNNPTFNSSNKGSISFDGTNTYVKVPHNTAHNILPITVQAWVKVVGGGDIINKYLSGSLNGYRISVSTAGILVYYFRGSSTEGLTNYDSRSGNIQSGVWTNVAVTITGAGAIIYQDGKQVGTRAWTGTVGACTTTQDLSIGFYPPSNYFGGEIATPKIYNTALSAQEIFKNYNATKGRFGL